LHCQGHGAGDDKVVEFGGAGRLLPSSSRRGGRRGERHVAVTMTWPGCAGNQGDGFGRGVDVAGVGTGPQIDRAAVATPSMPSCGVAKEL